MKRSVYPGTHALYVFFKTINNGGQLMDSLQGKTTTVTSWITPRPSLTPLTPPFTPQNARTDARTSPTLDRFVVNLAGRELVLFFSEGVSFSFFEPSALSLAYDNGIRKNASLSCSSAAHGRQDSWREVVLQLDEPCAATIVNTSLGANETSSDGTDITYQYVGGYSSDWNMLVQVGLLQGVEEDETRDTSATGGLLLNATSKLATDLSAAANALVAVVNLEESFPGEDWPRLLLFTWFTI